MTLTLRPARRRMKRRIDNLPAVHDCAAYGIWRRRPNQHGKLGLVCVVCGRP